MVDPFKAPKFEVPSEMRDLANKSVEQAKRAFDSFMGATQQAAGNLQGSTHSMQENAAKATKQVVGFAEQNVNAALLHAQAIVQAKGFEEVMKLQTDFMRNQMGAMQSQMKAMGETVQSATNVTPKAAAAKPAPKPAAKSKK
jgi:phasin